jgi:hypothetical protein
MAEIMHGAVTVDERTAYKTPGVNMELIGRAAQKLGRKKVPRRFFSNIRSHYILVKSVLGSVINGKTIPEEVKIVKFRDGRYITSDVEEIIAIEDSNAYGVDIFDMDQMDTLVEQRNIEFIVGLVEKNEAVSSMLRERFVADFLDQERGAEQAETKGETKPKAAKGK